VRRLRGEGRLRQCVRVSCPQKDQRQCKFVRRLRRCGCWRRRAASDLGPAITVLHVFLTIMYRAWLTGRAPPSHAWAASGSASESGNHAALRHCDGGCSARRAQGAPLRAARPDAERPVARQQPFERTIRKEEGLARARAAIGACWDRPARHRQMRKRLGHRQMAKEEAPRPARRASTCQSCRNGIAACAGSRPPNLRFGRQRRPSSRTACRLWCRGRPISAFLAQRSRPPSRLTPDLGRPARTTESKR